MAQPKILVAGGNGGLGGEIIRQLLLKGVDASRISTTTRSGSIPELSQKGVTVHKADYNQPATYKEPFKGVDRVLIMPGGPGPRVKQHGDLINAAKEAGVGIIYYVSGLHARKATYDIVSDHAETEKLLEASGVDWVVLGNGWYIQNWDSKLELGQDGKSGEIHTAAGDAIWNGATRDDLAEAAAVALADPDVPRNKVYSLAGDEDMTIDEYAILVGQVKGIDVKVVHHDEAGYTEHLVQSKVPRPFAQMIANAEAQAKNGWFADKSGDLRSLLGRTPTTYRQALEGR